MSNCSLFHSVSDVTSCRERESSFHVTMSFILYLSLQKLELINPFPKDKFLNMTKLKAFVDDKLNVAKMTISLSHRVENTVGKEENAGYQHFLLFPTVFFEGFFCRVVKNRNCVVKS